MQEPSNNQVISPAENSVPLVELRGLPIALYVYVLGAAILGYGVGVGVQDSTAHSLVPMSVGCVLCVAGYWLIRPYKKLAKLGISEVAARRLIAHDDHLKDADNDSSI